MARGRFRRLVAVLAGSASLGIVAVVVAGGFIQDDDASADIGDRIGAAGIDEVPLDPTGWFWATLVGGVLAVIAAVIAVRFSPAWPEMGSRYDGPAGAGSHSPDQAEVPLAERSPIEVWKSLDEGEDPTA